MELLLTLFPLVFTNNLVMSLVKFLAQKSLTRVELRAILAVLSVIGVISSSVLTGEPLQWNLLTEWGKFILETLMVYFGAHYSYKAIKTA